MIGDPPNEKSASKIRMATVWLGGCSGCHMSFLDQDEFLFELAGRVTIVYSPLADIKEYPEDVDLALVEGAVANQENLELAHIVRKRSRTVVAFGDCAVTGNVTALRNPLGDPKSILRRVYVDKVDRDPAIPSEEVPSLLPKVLPLQQVIDVDLCLPGCPPTAAQITAAVLALLDGTEARRDAGLRFG
jgi:NAD-reducing hydrogenase small subunit